MITVDGLLFDYPTVRALHGVSFTVETETITALVGPNGAGKTTLLRCLAALETPLSGKITVDDVDVAERPRAAHRRIGFLQDFFGLYDDLSVRRCLRHHAAAHDVPRAERPQRIAITAERLGLTERLDQKAGQLSRGFRQRVAIGQAIIHGPKVLMLDEPAAGLDPEARQELSNLLLTLRAEGMTIIVSSHILPELADVCTRVGMIEKGVMQVDGYVDEVMQKARQAVVLHIQVTGDAGAAAKLLEQHEQVELIDIVEKVASPRTLTSRTTQTPTLVVRLVPGTDDYSELPSALIAAGYRLKLFREEEVNLETAFMELTKGTQQ